MSEQIETPVNKVEYWFDPVCPWAWMTSRWMTEINAKLDLDVEWHPFSLQILNEGNDTGSHQNAHARGFELGQLLMLVKEQHGNDAVAKLYTELGNRIHLEEREDTDEIARESLEAVGVDTELVEARKSHADTSAAALRESTERGIEAVGPGVGIPIISVNGSAFFGPVVTPAPKGDDALKLWQTLLNATQTPGFFELKRGRDVGPDFS